MGAKYDFKLRNRQDWTDALQPQCNDIVFENGFVVLCTGEEKCSQDLDVMLIKPYDENNPVFGLTGCAVYLTIGKNLSENELVPMLETIIRDGIKGLHKRQKGARFRPEEIIDDTNFFVFAGKNSGDLTHLLIAVKARSLAGSKIVGMAPYTPS